MIPLLIGLGIIFIPLGITFLSTSNSVQEYFFDYTNCLSLAPSEFAQSPTGTFEWRKTDEGQCEVRFKVAKEMEGPVLQYYRLTNYYQNQRLYVRSVNWDQLKGKPLERDALSECSPLIGPDSDKSAVYYPCGLIANSMFSDRFGPMIQVDSKKEYSFPPNGIAWPSDSRRYGKTSYTLDQIRPPPFWAKSDLVDSDGKYKSIPDLNTDERFQVWMRVAGLPTFRKPYGKHQGSIPSGSYTVLIDAKNFEVKSYGGTKALVISTTSWMGGKNPALGIIYTVTGTVFLLFAILFLVKHMWRPRALGDVSYLSWLRS